MRSRFRRRHLSTVRLGSHRQRDLLPAAFKPDDEGKVPLQPVMKGCDRERGGSGLKAMTAARTTKDPAEIGPPPSLSPLSSSVPHRARTIKHCRQIETEVVS
ncbi:hypothetical protein E2562_008498 [Oryza meyeriana var. granulata]|uniref:Uncharacterized protein n=1 Tax=Oryza meyeriana var. granulata TaxID=110450 RepID=A0A6G1EHN9_9ORYZ|nr:hypothetical protein E2562_008498 [Oryza meyeriana var. granulata]